MECTLVARKNRENHCAAYQSLESLKEMLDMQTRCLAVCEEGGLCLGYMQMATMHLNPTSDTLAQKQ